MEKTNTIITIGRQFGSAGREIGYRIADDFGIKLYDKEMLNRAAKESGICEELFEAHDEKPTNSFLYSLVMDTYSLGYFLRELYGYADQPQSISRPVRCDQEDSRGRSLHSCGPVRRLCSGGV